MAGAARCMTKSPIVVARCALKTGMKALPHYASPFSKRKFSQPQLFAMLVLKAFFKTDYRGIVAILKDSSDLCRTLKLKSVPHYSTLAHAEKRLLKKGNLTYSRKLSFDMQGNPLFFEVPHGQSSMRLA